MKMIKMGQLKDKNENEIKNNASDLSKSLPKKLSNFKQFDNIVLKLKDSRVFKGLFVEVKEGFVTIKLKNGYNIGIRIDNISEVEQVNESENRISSNQKNSEGYSRTKRKQNEGLLEENRNSLKSDRELEQTASKRRNSRKSKKRILIIHTGGTIASKVDYDTGGVKALITADEILSIVPELKDLAEIHTTLLMNVFSEDLEVKHYNLILKEIEKNYDNYDGFIITHGTDTMHYTSAALKFAIDNLRKPIILVGAQRSSDRPSTDSRLNLISAVYFIVNTNYYGVGICMHYNLDDQLAVVLDGFNARKMHSSRRDAFKQIGKRPIAIVDYYNQSIRFLTKGPYYFNDSKNQNSDRKRDYSKDVEISENINQDTNREINERKHEDKIKINYYKENLKIGVLYSHPSLNQEELKCYDKFDAVLILGTGLGHVSINENQYSENGSQILKQIKQLISKHTIVAMSLQTIYGRVNLNTYSTGRILKSIGVIGNLTNMTPETAYIKLHYILSNYNNLKKKLESQEQMRNKSPEREAREEIIKVLYESNLKGEQIEREFEE